ncbi:centromere protein M isoform X4 [Mustela putorius furo]|uniref:Centromere protein M n=1 Tax=Mustela putorius furo TaxID=9669 RepID=A0A8U0NIF3_MUSPF|nr:centromere protein M isoform X4 [Mustela putorius furo]
MQCSGLAPCHLLSRLPLAKVVTRQSYLLAVEVSLDGTSSALPLFSPEESSPQEHRGNSHLARSLPLPSNMNRPRIDLIMFVVNLHSKYSLRNVEESLRHVDATFFLGKVGFLATGAGRESHCSVHRSTVVRLARTYRSPLLFCDPEDLETAVSPWTLGYPPPPPAVPSAPARGC